MSDNGVVISITQMYELMLKLDGRLDRMQTDLEVIKEKQSTEVQRIQMALQFVEQRLDQEVTFLKKELDEAQVEAKAAHDKIAGRDRLWLTLLVSAILGIGAWLIQIN